MTSKLEFWERRALVGWYGTTSSLRYNGAILLRALKVRRRILNSILDLTGSQCSEANIGKMCSLFFVLVMSGHVLQHFGQAAESLTIVLNAALRYNRTTTDRNPWSEAIRWSLVTLARAVSVLWLALNPDWMSSYKLLSWRNSHSWLATTFSRIFQCGFFFRRGLITASLKDCGTYPDDNESTIN